MSEQPNEEAEWHAIVSQPHVKDALRGMARKTMERDANGELEEGGFGGDEEQCDFVPTEEAIEAYQDVKKRHYKLFQNLADM